MTTNQAGGFRVTNDRKPDGSFPLFSARGWQVSPTCLVGATGGKEGPKWPFWGNQAKMARHGPRSFDSVAFYAAGRRKTRFWGFTGNPETGLRALSCTKRGLRRPYGDRRFLEMRSGLKSPTSNQAGMVPGLGSRGAGRMNAERRRRIEHANRSSRQGF